VGIKAVEQEQVEQEQADPPAPRERAIPVPALLVNLVISATAGLVAATIILGVGENRWWPPVLVGTSVFLISMLASTALTRLTRLQSSERQRAYEAADQAESALAAQPDFKLGELLRYNANRLEKYHVQTRIQATWSFIASLAAMALGLLLLVLSAGLALNVDDNLEKSLVAALGAVSSIMAGYVARTFLRVHESALRQLNVFFGEEVAFGYVLTAERLTQSLPEEQKYAQVAKLIQAVMASGKELARSPSSLVGELADERHSRRRERRSRREARGNAVPTPRREPGGGRHAGSDMGRVDVP